ncbi:hypothetical protein RIF29_20520 [Crotalaria pallida]|uniref:Uncharacterized protein n=1 Tax=Crotalaria pallida TaxID=3830 RepID=A0AAN9F4N6_CROPI
MAAMRLGLPDTGLISYGEMVDQGQLITQAVSIPVIGDGDNGYGNALNVKRTVKGYIKAGFAGIMLEDQDPPPLPYLTEKESKIYDISLEVHIKPAEQENSRVVTQSNIKHLNLHARLDVLISESISRWWLKESLAHLDQSLKSLGAGLVLIKNHSTLAALLECINAAIKTTCQITRANTVIHGVIQNTFSYATSQPFSALPVMPVHAMTQQVTRYASRVM